MRSQIRRRFWIELSVALASTALLLLTALWPTWIELVFGVDPDNFSGTVEWLIVAAAFAVAAVFFGLARSEWRKATSFAG